MFSSCPSPVWRFVYVYLSDSAVCLRLFYLTAHSSLFLTSTCPFFFFSAVFLCVIIYLPAALLPELVTNVPVKRLVKHLYSTLGCVITFNPVPFLFCSLSQRRRLFSSTVLGETWGVIPVQPLSSLLSRRGGRGGRWRWRGGGRLCWPTLLPFLRRDICW